MSSSAPDGFTTDDLSVPSANAPTFLGNVYYVTDPSSGAPIAGWPPKLPLKGFRGLRGFKKGREGGQQQQRQERHQQKGRRTSTTTSLRGKIEDLGVKVFGAAAGASPGASLSDDDVATTSATSAAVAAAKREGPCTYFTSRVMAEKWRDAIRRPRGLFQFHRRRLWRPSDIPLGPVGVVACPLEEAYQKLCDGWGGARFFLFHDGLRAASVMNQPTQPLPPSPILLGCMQALVAFFFFSPHTFTL